MIKIRVIIILSLLTISNGYSQEIEKRYHSVPNAHYEHTDGPYVFIEKNGLIEKTIKKGMVFSRVLAAGMYDTVFPPEKSTYHTKKNIVALSDLHGQYDLAVKLFRNNKIIDKNLNWNFGKGHLVIVGDIFDRGDKVNELLWLIYKLEGQAKNEGGRVHFLLGNHEYMVLHNDLRYIHEKYNLTSELLNVAYNDLYGLNTVLGRWLRSKSTILKINNTVFVHGGVSADFMAVNDIDFDTINDIMRKSINRSKKEMKATDFYNIYYGDKSLIWYRGYFKDNLSETDITNLLKMVNSEHIVVGHCSNEEVVPLFNNKIFGVDSSIKKGKYGEVLFIKNKKFSRGTLDGKKIHF